MPTFDFECLECGHRFSDFVSIKDKEKVRCPECQSKVKQRFTGFQFINKSSSDVLPCDKFNQGLCGGCQLKN